MNIVHSWDTQFVNSVQDKNERRSEKLEDLVARLIDAAEIIIATSGLPALRARDVAGRAGCSVGAIYGAFADLDELVLAVNGRTLGAIVHAMRMPDDGSGPESKLVRMAGAYLSYAAQHRPRWAALFQHRMPPGRAITPAYAQQQAAAFALIEGPIAVLCPALPESALVARSLFSAVHGVIELGLDERIVAMPLPVLRKQLEVIVRAIVRGLPGG